MLIKPKEVAVKDADGVEKTFIISRLPAITGREILAKYPLSNAPKIGDYEVSKEAMLKMMAYVCVQVSGEEIPLKTQTLIDNHVPDGESLIRLELEMLKYNTSFFGKDGSLSCNGQKNRPGCTNPYPGGSGGLGKRRYRRGWRAGGRAGSFTV